MELGIRNVVWTQSQSPRIRALTSGSKQVARGVDDGRIVSEQLSARGSRRYDHQGVSQSGVMMKHAYWGCWIVGAILIALSRAGIVSPEVGWGGFWIATAAAVISRLPRRSHAEPDWAYLTYAMFESKDHGYERAMNSMHSGGSVVCDGGLIFRVCSENEIDLTANASYPVNEIDEALAINDADHAEAAFDVIAKSSPEIAALAAGRKVRVSLVSELGPNGVVICQIVDRHVEWSIERN